MLSISTNSGKELITLADEAEYRVIEQVRKLGQELLQGWANKESSRVSCNVAAQMPNAKNTLKKLWWHTTYGEVVVLEQSYYLKQGGTLRPFKISSGANTRSYSLPLQRVMTDFGSDESFTKACDKVKEHYGVNIPVSGERNVTLRHAKMIKQKLKAEVKAKTPVRVRMS